MYRFFHKIFKLKLIGFVIFFFLISTIPSFACEISGYGENELKMLNTDKDNLVDLNKIKLDVETGNDQYFMLISTNIVNTYNIDDADTTVFQLNRAYLSLYPKWGIVTIGKQRIAWGNTFYFNFADVFNQPNSYDPTNPFDLKGEYLGKGSFHVKWNKTDTSQMETVVVLKGNDSNDKNEYGLKYKWTLGRFDFTLYSIRMTNISPDISLHQVNIGECKGQFGNKAPGIWAQIATYHDTGDDRYTNEVIGSDYTVDIGEGLTILAEYSHNGSEDAKRYFFQTKYNFNSYYSLIMSGLWKDSSSLFYDLGIKYLINDNVEVSASYIIFPHGNDDVFQKEFLDESAYRDSEFVFTLKINF